MAFSNSSQLVQAKCKRVTSPCKRRPSAKKPKSHRSKETAPVQKATRTRFLRQDSAARSDARAKSASRNRRRTTFRMRRKFQAHSSLFRCWHYFQSRAEHFAGRQPSRPGKAAQNHRRDLVRVDSGKFIVQDGLRRSRMKRTLCGDARYAVVIPRPELNASPLRTKMTIGLDMGIDSNIESKFFDTPSFPVANFK